MYVQGPAHEGRAFAHADQAETFVRATCQHVGEIEPSTIVPNDEIEPIRAADEPYDDVTGFGVAGNVGQRLLDDPETGDRDVLRDLVPEGVRGKLRREPRTTPLSIEVPTNGRHESQVVEDRRAKRSREIPGLLERDLCKRDALREKIPSLLLAGFRERGAASKSFDTRYYNVDMHKAALALPEFVREALGE